MRAHGEGSLFQRRQGRGKGRWVAVVTLRDGRRASRTAKTREEAKAALAELLRLRDARAPITRNIRLGDYLERWVSDDHGLAPSTARKHESIIRVHLVQRLGHIRLSELSPADVSHCLQALGGTLDAQTVRHVRGTLRRCLADAVRDGLTDRNAAALAKPPKLRHKERTILDANQARILIESTRNTVYGPLWTMLVTTGMRISEALGLSWSDVDFGGNDGPAKVERTQEAHGRGHRRDPWSSSGGRSGSEHRGVVGHPSVPRLPAPSITVRRQLARENGEWVHRPPKTAKGRRTIPLTALGVEALRAQRTQQREWMAAYYGGSDGLETTKGRVGSGVGSPAPDAEAPRDEEVADWTRGDGPGGADHPAQHRTGRAQVRPRLDGELELERRAERAPDHAMRPVQRDPGAGAGITPIDGLVFTTSRGRPLHETNTLAALHKALAAAGLPRVSQHSLRHSCATVLISNGYPIEKVAKILGHTTPRITAEIYMHLTDKDTADSADVMERALG